MGIKKVISKRIIVWGATSVLLAGVLTTANVLTRGKYSTLLNQVFGGKRPIVAQTDDSIDFGQEFATKKEAYDNGNKVNEEICEEGMILLRNNNNALPLKKNAKVSVFGKNSVNLVYGGSGSAAPDKDGERKTIFNSLEDAGFSCNPTLKSFYEDDKASGSGRDANPDMENSGVPTLKTGETPQSSYTTDVKASYDEYGDAAFIVISRIAGENWDLPAHAADDSSRHYLELDNNERALIKAVCESGKFEHVILLLNGSNYIDLGFLKEGSNDPVASNLIDGCINIGSPGGSGIMALGRIVSGKVNPSGHTVDLVYTKYREDPTWQNFGGLSDIGNEYTSTTGTKLSYHTVQYEENIYFGYRYYETRGKTDGEAWYNEHVVYPFGYGLSYTTFTQEIVNKSELEGAALTANGKFDVKVKVTNTGNVEGKQVVQLYVNAPYENGKIEKAYKVLAGFAKTKSLAKNESETVTISVDPYYFASFDNHDANGDNFKGYTLDAGDYKFFVTTDSHTDGETFTKNLPATAKIEKDPVTNKNVVPLFDNVSEGIETNLSRTNWTGTFPTALTAEDLKIDGTFLAKLESYESGNNETYSTLPTMGAELEVKFRELVGLEYDDEKWDAFLDQLTFEEMLKLFNEGCYSTADITRTVDGEDYVVVPATTSADGPTGLVSFLGNLAPGAQPDVYGTCYYCSECIVAQTYNLELATKEAHAIGNEALIGNERGAGLAYPGWYAPGVNLHRSPFAGRNTEYYSEDPFLCGRFAGQVIKGVQEKGVYANVKHFALNDQETNRSSLGIATWCDEQAIRELYLRSFEMAVKEGKSKGLMTSFNRIGTTWAGGDYRLVTTILREEWGFIGSVICDFHTDTYMDAKQMLYCGGDLNLCGDQGCMLKIGSKSTNVKADDPKAANLLRQASHRLLYCIANSNAMKADVIGYKNPVWQNVETAATAGIGAGLAGWGAWAIISALKKKKTV